MKASDLFVKCLEEPGVHVMEVPIDYSGNTRILSQEIKDLSEKITV